MRKAEEKGMNIKLVMTSKAHLYSCVSNEMPLQVLIRRQTFSAFWTQKTVQLQVQNNN
jgi:hypothetical protein